MNQGGATLKKLKSETSATSFKELSLSNIGDMFTSAFNSAATQSRINRVATTGFDTGGIDYDLQPSKEDLVLFQQTDFSGSSNQLLLPNQLYIDLPDIMGIGNKNNPNGKPIRYENAFKFPSSILSSMNMYVRPFMSTVNQIIPLVDSESNKDYEITSDGTISVVGTPSLFNKWNAIKFGKGIDGETPLFNGIDSDTKVNMTSYFDLDGDNSDLDITINDINSDFDNDTDCSISALVAESKKRNSKLGFAQYTYADFMFCKDLGKISNNHLITLRKFAHPVGDNIFNAARFNGKDNFMEGEPDRARLVTWFGTEDNKLENILNYSCHATFKEFNSKFQDVETQNGDGNESPLGNLLNSLNPSYNRMQAGGFTGNNNLISNIFGGKSGQYQNHNILRRYDNNKIYEPKNTIQETHQYEGKLKFSQEFTLTFRYQMRAYDNINPKSAFLDLIGNILEVTYRKGTFWGGDRWWIGPPQNHSGWSTANSLINKALGIGDNMISWLQNFSFANLMDGLTNLFKMGWQTATDLIKGGQDAADKITGGKSNKNEGTNKGGVTGTVEKAVQKTGNFIANTGLIEGLKGQIKNSLGRPAIYALDSILSGSPVGLWHLTIGNPKNPIMVMGNLIIDDATITHSGPLGLDDFPTELTVKIKLKHGRPRDATEIARMYTKGLNSIYMPLATKRLNQYFNFGQNNLINQFYDTTDFAQKKDNLQYTKVAKNAAAEEKWKNEMKDAVDYYNSKEVTNTIQSNTDEINTGMDNVVFKKTGEDADSIEMYFHTSDFRKINAISDENS